MNDDRYNIVTTNTHYIYLFILFSLTFTYTYFFWNLPLSEDAGYYAFLSKAISNGITLHNDMPVTTNSLLLYITAGIFKLVGSTKLVFRLIYAVGYLVFILSMYQLICLQRSKHEAFIASLCAAVLIMIPHVMLDLGRNQIIWSLAMMMIGLYWVVCSRYYFVAGSSFAIAALMRETFLIVVVAMCLALAFNRLLTLPKRYSFHAIRPVIFFYCGVIMGLSINALLLTYYHAWNSYFADMLHSGVSFRYSHTFALKHIIKNISQFSHGFNHFYGAIICFAVLSYLFRTKLTLINWLKYLLLPLFFIEAVIVNRTTTYSIVPTLAVCSILSLYFWAECITFILTTSNHFIKRSLLFLVVTSMSLIAVSYHVPEIYHEYYAYYQIAKNDKAQSAYWVTERVKNIISNLPVTTKISTGSMYPLLFEMNAVSYAFPYLYDLTMPLNLFRPDVLKGQIISLNQQEADIIIFKTMTDFNLSHLKEEMINNNYIVIADFNAARESTVASYKNRILMSKQFFTAHYTHTYSRREKLNDSVITIKNPSVKAIIIGVRPTSEPCMLTLRVKNDIKEVSYQTNDYKTPAFYSLILPKSSVVIAQTQMCSKKADYLNIDVYERY